MKVTFHLENSKPPFPTLEKHMDCLPPVGTVLVHHTDKGSQTYEVTRIALAFEDRVDYRGKDYSAEGYHVTVKLLTPCVDPVTWL